MYGMNNIQGNLPVMNMMNNNINNMNNNFNNNIDYNFNNNINNNMNNNFNNNIDYNFNNMNNNINNNFNNNINNMNNNMNNNFNNNINNMNNNINNMNNNINNNINNNFNNNINNNYDMPFNINNNINMNINQNMNMNYNMDMNMNMNLKDNIINLNIHLNDSKTVQLQISEEKTVEELSKKIKGSYNINYQFKLKFENKPLVNSLTLAESGLQNGSNVFVIKLKEKNNVNINKYSFSRYKKAAKTGLKNLGDTSYLNSVFQLLGIVRNLVSYFVNPNNEKKFKENLNEAPLTYVIHRLNLHLYPYPEKGTREIYKPDSQLQILGYCDERYRSKERRNPIELIELCLRLIHKENNKKKGLLANPNPLNKEQVILDGVKNFIHSNESIISNCFYWLKLTSKHCFSCNSYFYYLDHFQTIKLDIFGTSQRFIFPLTISKCLEYQSYKKDFSFCQRCCRNTAFEIYSKIYSSPNWLIFLIERENNGQNLLNIPFSLEKYINIQQFLENNQTPSKFELKGIVSISVNDNYKYVCFGQSPVDNNWYLYNDELVNDINENLILNSAQGYIPYILLYKYCE